MKKIGLLFGQENTFPQAFVERVRQRNVPGISAEFVTIDKVIQGNASDYSVIIDRISQDVPFYRSWLKHAAIGGTAVINNPFWWSADEKFVNNELAAKIGVAVPRTVLLPSRELPDNTADNSFRNLLYPLDWPYIFDHVRFPAYMKPFAGGGWRHVYRLESSEQFFEQHATTGQLVMLLQEEIVFDSYYRCYCIGGKHVHIMPYDPRLPHHQRYEASYPDNPALLETIREQVIRLNQYLGYDFNTVEMAVRDGIPYAIDFCNPAPDADIHSVGAENFEWVVNTAADYAIERALAQVPGQDNLTWGGYLQGAVGTGGVVAAAPRKKAAAPKKTDKAAPAKKATEKAKADKPKEPKGKKKEA
ncbi:MULTISPECIES: RimK family alpha-L-glutamate ligase [Chitinophaga]|uniref:ATP-grasp domain-containing protein n=1 Tax=Chitinophaga TaxID=79328 RepID=UPI000BAF7CA2|nr:MULTISPECIES: hypothetical protein [Chitinophaga]ASZ12007.1 hypothetical protein CK934_14085 [Chitinophaga sp. MD30]